MRLSSSVFLVRDPGMIMSSFAICSEPGCMQSSRVGEFKSMTLRTGLSYCIDHVKMEEVANRSVDIGNSKKMTVIFYDIELTRGNEIDQIGACSESNKTFDSMIRIVTRNNNSPIIRGIPSKYWSWFASEPRNAIERFVNWADFVHTTESGGDTNPDNIMLVAHNGSNHDHVYTVKMMMSWGLKAPKFRFADSLAMFKVVKGMDRNTKLSRLASEYAAWISRVPHDAGSDAKVLRFVTMSAFDNIKVACYVFSISWADYTARTGLDMFVPSPMVSFPRLGSDYSLVRRTSIQSEGSIVTRSSF